MDKQLFNLKFAVKRLNRAAAKSQRDERTERASLHRAMLASNPDKARVHAESAIRHRHQSLLYLRLAARLDGLIGRVQVAQSMRSVGDSMRTIVNEVERAVEGGRLEEVSKVMGRFEEASDKIAVQSDSLQQMTMEVAAGGGLVDEVRQLMQQVADENGLMVDEALLGVGVPVVDNKSANPLEDRLAKLREL